jgi:hypothetical protein
LRWISGYFNTAFIHTLEKERRTCLSFLVFGRSIQLSALSPTIFTAKDAEEEPEKFRRKALLISRLLDTN